MRINACTILVLAAAFAGCSGTGVKNPAAPAGPAIEQSAVETNRHMWGIWDVLISADRATAEVVPLRTADMHLNAVRLLEVTPCTNCITISNVHPSGPDECSADLKLRHPFPGLLKYTGFDVRGIFISQADFTFPASGRKIALGDGVPRMVEPDGYTSLFNPTEFPPTTPAALGYFPGKHATGGDLSATLNPFVAYKKDAPRRMFEAGTSETKTVRIHTPVGPIHFGYAVDVCWQLVDKVVDPVKDFPPDANCLEAYAISVNIGSGLQQFVGSSVPINVEIYDHQGQDTISSVTIESPALFNGEMGLAFSAVMPDSGFLFTATLSNALGAAAGAYPVLVKATDTQADQNLGEVAAWQIATATISLPKGWARTWGGSGDDPGNSVAVDGSGNAYIAGWFRDTVDFDPGAGVDNHTSNGLDDVFLSKFDPNGNFVWARTWGGTNDDLGYSVAIDGSGNAYVTGDFDGTVDFDPGVGVDNHTSNGGYDVFLSKFDPNGNFVWARTWGGSDSDSANSVAIDDSGNAYVAGWFNGPVDFDPGAGVENHTSNGGADIFLSKFDPNGNFVWTRTWGGPGSEGGYSVAIDGSGNAHITGDFYGTVDFDPGAGVDNHTSNGDYDIFLSKFDPNGNFVWARTWGGSMGDSGNSVAINGFGNVYVMGYFSDTVDFDPGAGVDNHTSNGEPDIFLSKFDPNGDFVWARTWDGISNNSGFSLAIDGSGDAYMTGYFYGTVDFDPGAGVDNHTSNGSIDPFLSKFDSNGNFIWARTWGGLFNDVGLSVATDGSGNAYIAGDFIGTVDFDPGEGVDNHTSNDSEDVFLSKFLPDGNW